MTISFRANNNYPAQNTQQKNAIGLTENGQNILNKTNEYANHIDLTNTILDSEKRKDNLGTALKNTIMLPIMSSPTISAAYVANEYRKGAISKEDALKIVAYNTIT
jgi:hypothetical protein